jgi:alkyl hydroperoxide reductase subunit AhpC
LRDHENEFTERGVKIVVVTFENDSFAKFYVNETSLAWPLLVDRERKTYADYGMLKASFMDVWGPRSLMVYSGELLKGHLPKAPHDDIYQRGGDVLVDPEGIVRLHHVGSGPADRPPPEAILRRIE